jgi:hypothetical protein
MSRFRELLDSGEINGKPIKGGRQVADLLAEVVLRRALEGDHRFMETALKYTEPSPETTTEADALKSALDPDVAERLMAAVMPDVLPDLEPGVE